MTFFLFLYTKIIFSIQKQVKTCVTLTCLVKNKKFYSKNFENDGHLGYNKLVNKNYTTEHILIVFGFLSLFSPALYIECKKCFYCINF